MRTTPAWRLLTLSRCNFHNEFLRLENSWVRCSSPATCPSLSLPGSFLCASSDFVISPCVPPSSTRPTQYLAVTVPWSREGLVCEWIWGWAGPSSIPVVVSRKGLVWVFPSLPGQHAQAFSGHLPFPAGVVPEGGLSSAPALFGEQERPGTRAQIFAHSPGPD